MTDVRKLKLVRKLFFSNQLPLLAQWAADKAERETIRPPLIDPACLVGSDGARDEREETSVVPSGDAPCVGVEGAPLFRSPNGDDTGRVLGYRPTILVANREEAIKPPTHEDDRCDSLGCLTSGLLRIAEDEATPVRERVEALRRLDPARIDAADRALRVRECLGGLLCVAPIPVAREACKVLATLAMTDHQLAERLRLLTGMDVERQSQGFFVGEESILRVRFDAPKLMALSYDKLYAWLREAQHQFREILATVYEDKFNQRVRTLPGAKPTASAAEKQELAIWVNNELAALGLAVAVPNTSKPAVLLGQRRTKGDLFGYFSFETVGHDGKREREANPKILPELLHLVPTDKVNRTPGWQRTSDLLAPSLKDDD